MLKGTRPVVILDLIHSYVVMLAPHVRARGIMLKCHHFSALFFSPHQAKQMPTAQKADRQTPANTVKSKRNVGTSQKGSGLVSIENEQVDCKIRRHDAIVLKRRA